MEKTKLTIKEFEEKCCILHNNKYRYCQDYTGYNNKIKIMCPTHGIFFQQAGLHLCKKYGCKKCSTEKYKKIHARTNEQFLEESINIHGDKFEYLSEYTNNKCKIKIKCKKCNNTFYQFAYSHLEGCGCMICARRKYGDTLRFTVEEFENKCNRIHGDKFKYYQDYCGYNKYVKVMCVEHNEIFYQKAYLHLSAKESKCSKCKNKLSYGERQIAKFLNKHNILYKTEHTFDNCVYKGKLRFDFYLFDSNTCIEYDGQFHYIDIPFSENNLEQTKIRDEIKNRYCLDNNIKLIRIPYTMINSVEEILSKELGLYNDS